MFFILCMKLSIENTSEKLKVKYYYHVYFMRIWERWKEFICTSILSLGFFFFFFKWVSLLSRIESSRVDHTGSWLPYLDEQGATEKPSDPKVSPTLHPDPLYNLLCPI